MKKIGLPIFTVLLVLITISSCSTRKVTRIDPNQAIDLSGRWNSTDAQMTATSMIDQVMSDRWLTDFMEANGGKKPVVIVGFVKNNTSEHIDSELFLKELEKSFVRSGRVTLVQGGEKREQLRAERADQQNFSSPETIAKWGREIGANFMLQGDMGSIVDQYQKEKVIFYKINLQLTNIETNQVVWIGDKEIKKYINK